MCLTGLLCMGFIGMVPLAGGEGVGHVGDGAGAAAGEGGRGAGMGAEPRPARPRGIDK